MWAGLAVFLVADAARRLVVRPSRPEARAAGPAAPTHARPNERRILVVANETVGGRACSRRSTPALRGLRREHVLVVTPALNSPLSHWASDEDNARAAGAEAARREPRAAARWASRRGARSATATRCRRSRTRSGPSARTRSSSRRTREAARTGSSRASSRGARALRGPDHARRRRPRRANRRSCRAPTQATPDASVRASFPAGDGLLVFWRSRAT